MKKILKKAMEQGKNGKDSVFVSVISAQGSTPRKVGAMMLVGEQGLLAGTVGGGLLEHEAIATGLDLLGETRGKVVFYQLDNENAREQGMICGGTTELLYSICPPEIENIWSGKSISFPLDGAAPFPSAYEGGFPTIVAEENVIIFPLKSGGRVFVFGAGHVSQALGQLLEFLDFSYVVVDDREEFCNQNRFPKGEIKKIRDFSSLPEELAGDFLPGKNDAICIMTRGHQGDLEAIKFSLDTEVSYLGVMGSRSKKAKVFQILAEDGYLNAKNRIKTPIGLEIGAETPGELAVSVVSELILWRASQRKEGI